MSKAIKLSTKSFLEGTNSSLIKGYKNIFNSPNIDKISINIGVGKYDSKQKETIASYLAKLTGQKPKRVISRKSVSNFKLRKGDLVGLVVTLRKERAYNFLLKLIYIALPRSRDFKGLSRNLFDKNQKTYSIGIKSASIFPTVGFGASTDFGMQINITFKDSRKDNIKLLEMINFPLAKVQA